MVNTLTYGWRGFACHGERLQRAMVNKLTNLLGVAYPIAIKRSQRNPSVLGGGYRLRCAVKYAASTK